MSEIRTTSDAPSAVPAPDHSFRNRLVISLLLVSAFVVILNETVMNVALPDLMKDPQGHQGVPVWIPITAGAVSLGGLIWRQLVLQRADQALLDLRVFRSGATPASSIEASVHRAFVCGAALSLLLVVGELFVRKPATEG